MAYGLVVISVISFFQGFKMPTFYQMLGALYIGLLSRVIGFFLWVKCVNEGNVVLLSNINYLNPFVSAFFAYLVLSEEIIPMQIMGLLVIITGILIQNLKLSSLSLAFLFGRKKPKDLAVAESDSKG